MKTFDNEITIHQGESFTIDKLVENKDGSPYIISNKLVNPYFLLTVSSSKYSQSNRYVKNYWLDLVNFPRFLSTKPIPLSSIKTSATSNVAKYTTFPTGLLEGYVNGVYVKYDRPDDAVFYNERTKEYKYYETKGDDPGWKDYTCRIVKHFSSKDTEEWTGQSYVYSIRLVSGSKSTTGDKPIVVSDNTIEILSPTKLSVLTNIRGGL